MQSWSGWWEGDGLEPLGALASRRLEGNKEHPSTTRNPDMTELKRSQPVTPPARKEWQDWRAWLDFGPRAGIHAYLAADLTVVVIASFLTILYIWVDRPGPSDAGQQTLSGWLVGIFGPRWALPGGLALFSALSVVLLGLLIAYARWVGGPRRERRLRRKASKV
jgi:hypothetical protein